MPSYRYIKKLGASKLHIIYAGNTTRFPLCGRLLTGAWLVSGLPVWEGSMDDGVCVQCEKIWKKAKEQEQST